MGNSYIWDYIYSCAVGNATLSDCRPVWDLGVIGSFLLLALLTFLILVTTRVREDARLAAH
jgi:hypothetical protein